MQTLLLLRLAIASTELIETDSVVVDNIRRTAENTTFGPIDGISFAIAAVSLIVAVLAAIYTYNSMVYARETLVAQVQTEANTNRLDRDVQRKLFVDMCRHLYRNLVTSYTIAEKLRHDRFRSYPSEEHLLKMAVLLDDVHDELFYKDPVFFDVSRLFVMLRNYNIELGVISDHLRDASLDEATKERDLRTLIFKCGFLTEKIFEIMDKAWPGVGRDEVLYAIFHQRHPGKESYDFELTPLPAKLPFTPYREPGVQSGKPDKRSFYVRELYAGHEDYFVNELNEDVRIEYGSNTAGGSKIHLIPFKA